jgi:hypothetical protein
MAIAQRAIGATIGKRRIDFFCDYCQQNVHGWPYGVGSGGNRCEVCAACWATPRLPPMKPLFIECDWCFEAEMKRLSSSELEDRAALHAVLEWERSLGGS